MAIGLVSGGRSGGAGPRPIAWSQKNQGPTWLVVDLPLVGNILLMVNMIIIWLMMINNILVGGCVDLPLGKI